jgi:hypothetical protein
MNDTNNQTTMRGQDLTNALGQGQLANSVNQTNNQFTLGQQANNNQLTGINNSYNLGLQANNNQLTGINNQYQLGLGQNQNQADANANTLALGQGQLANQQTANTNSLNLGMGNLALGNRNADINGQLAGSTIMTQGINNAIGIGNALYTSGQNELNAPGSVSTAYQNWLNGLLPATGTATGTPVVKP